MRALAALFVIGLGLSGCTPTAALSALTPPAPPPPIPITISPAPITISIVVNGREANPTPGDKPSKAKSIFDCPACPACPKSDTDVLTTPSDQ